MTPATGFPCPRPDYSASRPSLRLHGPPFLEQPTLRLALSAPSLAASFGLVSIAEVALFQRNSTQTLHVAWTSKTSKHFLVKMSLLFKRHYTRIGSRTRPCMSSAVPRVKRKVP